MHDRTDPLESIQIRIARVLCIVFMMSVHVNPGPGQPSAITTGAFAMLGDVWINLFGRASVAALSFISGYLLIRTASAMTLSAYARRRFSSLIVPMLVWNLVFAAMLVVKVRVVGLASGNDLLDGSGGLLAALTGLTGPTANLSLFFLRDLFVAAVLVQALRGPILRFWRMALVLVAIVTLFDLAEPVIFRPSILLFVVAGAIWAGRAARLPARPDWRWILAEGLVVAGIVVLRASGLDATGPGREAVDVLRRVLLTGAVLALTAWLAATGAGLRIARLERRIFETYLLHVPLISTLWVGWTLLVGPAEAPSYVVFFLAAPFVALIAGQVFGGFADRLPAPVQRLIRGRAVPRDGGTGAAARLPPS
mgnify:CR=1 FL=1